MAMTKEQALALASARLRLKQQQAQPQDQPEQPGFMSKLGRAAGITGRGLAQGFLSLPAMAGDIAAYPVNAISRLSGGQDVFPPQQQALSSLFTRAGLPVPETSAENLVSSISTGIGGAASGLGLGNQLAQSASPAVAGVGNILRSAPASQVAAGASGGVSGELARQRGLGQFGQSVAGIAGGIGGGLTAQRMLPAAWNPNYAGQGGMNRMTETPGMKGFSTEQAPLPKGASLTKPSESASENSAFGTAKPLFDAESASNADRTAQYRKSVEILDNAGVELSKGQRSGTGSIRAVETTLETLPFVGKPLQNLADKTRISYQKQLLKLAGNETGDTMVTRESLERTADALSKRYADALKGKSVSISDDSFLNDLAAIEAKHTDLVDSGTANKVRDIVNQFLNKASKEGAFSGEKYQAQRSIFAQRAKGTSNMASLYDDLKVAMDDAFRRASGGKGALDSKWAQFKQLESIYNNSGGSLASEGFISLIQVARRASGSPGSREWRDFTRAAATVLPDRLPNTGSGQRAMIAKAAMGGGIIGGAGPLAYIEPLTALGTAGSVLGSRGIASRLAAQPGQSPYQLNPLLFPSMMGNK